MKIIYSLSTSHAIHGRMNKNHLEVTIRIYRLSMLKVLQFYPDVTLFTDAVGFNYFKDLNLKIVLLEDSYAPHWWHGAKYEAMQRTTAPFIHLDGDIFIGQLMQGFKFNTDMLLERKEMEYRFLKSYLPMFNHIRHATGVIPYWHSNIKEVYNVGVFGFNDNSFKEEFINDSLKLMKNIDALELGIRHLPIVVEQWLCYLLCIKQKKTVSFLLPGNTYMQQSIIAKKIKYCHLFGEVKYRDDITIFIKNYLKSLADDMI